MPSLKATGGYECSVGTFFAQIKKTQTPSEHLCNLPQPVTGSLVAPANNNELRRQMAMNGRRGHLAAVMDYIMCNHAHCPL